MSETKLNRRSSNFKDLTGKRFGKLVVKRLWSVQKWAARWKCLCDCGNFTVVLGSNLKARYGHTQSCGCLAKEGNNKSHERTGTREHKSWSQMLYRCRAKTGHHFKYYASRRITVCDRWKKSFLNFVTDMGERPAGHTLDRINPKGNYEPSNCRWANKFTQAQNKVRKKKKKIKTPCTWREIPPISPKYVIRFWSKVDKTNGPDSCWFWTDTLNKDGYGKFHLPTGIHWSQGRAHMFSVPRVAYKIAHGSIPNNRLICHTCDNPRCVNPKHLKLGTQFDNMQQMISRGRGNKAHGEKHSKSKLTEKDVLEIRKTHGLKGIGGISAAKLAKKFGVSYVLIRAIATKKIWKHVV